MRFKIFALSVFLYTTLAFPVPSLSQNGQAPPINPNVGSADERDEEERAKLVKEMAKKANRERQVQLQRDTDNLLKLATELKQYVDKSNENTLSLNVIKKAEEIEKLAHSVREKMKAN